MDRAPIWAVISPLVAILVLAGCHSVVLPPQQGIQEAGVWIEPITQIEDPVSAAPRFGELIGAPPRTLRDSENLEYRDLSLQEAIHLALRHSKVMRDLGGSVLRSPQSVPTAMDPAIQETDPQFGLESAAAAFDAAFSTSLFFEKNDRPLNNTFLGDGGVFTQDIQDFQAQIAKRSVNGSQFAIRHIVDFDRNNNVGNQFSDGAWDVLLEGEVRHSLLQGGGLEFNRIAGPGSRPGEYNGILIARVRTDISLADFQMGIRDLVSDVENAYWDLYFAYRNLDTKTQARNATLQTWRRVSARHGAERRGGEAEKEAQAREQYYRFEEEVQNALMGRPLDGTRIDNGSAPGTFRGLPGVFVNERKLRLLIGLLATDEQVIRPSDEPPVAPVSFDWAQIATEALARRSELRQQRWRIKGYELQVTASKNFLLPELDVVGRYRWRGFGDSLVASSGSGSDAYGDLADGDFQEWQIGLEASMPIGFRQGHAAEQNACLRLAKARCVLVEQERQVIHDLNNAVGELDRAYTVLQTNINRVEAAKQQLLALEVAYEADKADFFVLLDAHRRNADAQSRYYRSRLEYALAVRNVYFERGALLDYCCVSLSEGSWPEKAHFDAAQRELRRGKPRPVDYRIKPPPILTMGRMVPPAEPTPAASPVPLAAPLASQDPPVPKTILASGPAATPVTLPPPPQPSVWSPSRVEESSFIEEIQPDQPSWTPEPPPD